MTASGSGCTSSHLYSAPADRRRYHLIVCTFAGGAVAATNLLRGTIFGAVVAGTAVVAATVIYRRGRNTPIDQTVRGYTTARDYVRELPTAVLFGLGFGIATTVLVLLLVMTIIAAGALITGTLSGIGGTLPQVIGFAGAIGFVMAVSMVAMHVADVGTHGVFEEPPAHFVGRGPNALIVSARNHGLVSAAAAAGFLTPAVLAMHHFGLGDFTLLVPILAVVMGYLSGLNSWCYFHWARWRLACAGFLPLRLRAFLEWAADDTGWLRAGDGYEFRHKELLDHLAREIKPVGAANFSLGERRAAHDPGIDGGRAARQRERKRSRSQIEERRGNRLLRSKDFDGALAAFDAAIQGDPDAARPHRARTQALNALGRHEEQLESARRAVALDPTDPMNHNALGVAHARLGDNVAAITSYERAEQLDPRNALYPRNLAIALSELGRNQKVLDALDRAAKIQPLNASQVHWRSTVLGRLGRDDERLVAVRRSVDLNPDDYSAHAELAVALRRNGWGAASSAARGRAVELVCQHFPDTAAGTHARRSVAGYLNACGFSADAAAVAEIAVRDAPEHVQCLDDLAHAYSELERYAEADAQLQRTYALPRTAEQDNSLANALVARGRPDDAAQVVTRALEAEPDNMFFAFTRAETSIARADLDAARRELQSALAIWQQQHRGLDPGDPAWLCRVLWRNVTNSSVADFIDMLVTEYSRDDLRIALAGGLIDGTPTSAEQTGWDAVKFESWCISWEQHAQMRAAVDTLRSLAL